MSSSGVDGSVPVALPLRRRQAGIEFGVDLRVDGARRRQIGLRVRGRAALQFRLRETEERRGAVRPPAQDIAIIGDGGIVAAGPQVSEAAGHLCVVGIRIELERGLAIGKGPVVLAGQRLGPAALDQVAGPVRNLHGDLAGEHRRMEVDGNVGQGAQVGLGLRGRRRRELRDHGLGAGDHRQRVAFHPGCALECDSGRRPLRIRRIDEKALAAGGQLDRLLGLQGKRKHHEVGRIRLGTRLAVEIGPPSQRGAIDLILAAGTAQVILPLHLAGAVHRDALLAGLLVVGGIDLGDVDPVERFLPVLT